MGLVRLIYVSSATKELSDAELDAILESSVIHNGPQSVTGMLLYSAGNFMQVLEGEEAAVTETYGRICKDPRHTNIFLLSGDDIDEREFSAWSMGFQRVTPLDAEKYPAFAPMFINGFDAEQIQSVDGLATDILKKFSKV